MRMQKLHHIMRKNNIICHIFSRMHSFVFSSSSFCDHHRSLRSQVWISLRTGKYDFEDQVRSWRPALVCRSRQVVKFTQLNLWKDGSKEFKLLANGTLWTCSCSRAKKKELSLECVEVTAIIHGPSGTQRPSWLSTSTPPWICRTMKWYVPAACTCLRDRWIGAN